MPEENTESVGTEFIYSLLRRHIYIYIASTEVLIRVEIQTRTLL